MDPRKVLVQAAALIALAGCDMAYRREDYVVTFDGGSVQFEQWLRDVRFKRGGVARALPEFVSLSKQDFAKEDPPVAVRWVRYDGGVDVVGAVTVPRDLFDRCAREACDGGTSKECPDVSVKLCGSTYAASDPDVSSFSASGNVLRWSKGPDGEPADGESAAALFAAYEQSPERVEATAEWMRAYDEAFTSGKVDRVRKLIEATTADGGVAGSSAVLDEAIRETALRHRQLLLRAYLDQHGYKVAIGDPPGGASENVSAPGSEILPKKPFAEPIGLKLRIAYEVARAGYIENGQHADAQAILVEVCSDKHMRDKGAKRFCELLLAQPPKPSPAVASPPAPVPGRADGGERDGGH
jgi:hypothetical protein